MLPGAGAGARASCVRIGVLLQAWRRNYLKGDLWNNALSELVRDAPAPVLWWRAVAAGTLVLLSARNVEQVCVWLERLASRADEKLVSDSDAHAHADAGRAELARIHAAAGCRVRAHPEDRALEQAELALGFPVCALEFDAPTPASYTWHLKNAHLAAAVQEGERLLTAITTLDQYFPDEWQSSRALRWALQYAGTLLARAHLLPVLEHVLWSKNIETLKPYLDLLTVRSVCICNYHYTM